MNEDGSEYSWSGVADRDGEGLDFRIHRHLRGDERLVWLGGPDPDARFIVTDFFEIPFGLLFAAGSMLPLAVLFSGGPVIPFAVIGPLFLCSGLYAAVGRIIRKRWLRQRTRYAVTTERALIAVGTRSLREAPLHILPMSFRHSRDGRHVTVIIGGNGKPAPLDETSMLSKRKDVFAFYDVPNPDALLAALANTELR
ncbi:hypothetical protein ACFXHA_34370 [Nocardia sp. NPDC059240]|uniref:hypothetical protein n=1 Tax=Nocardia sp. NPDC059240 TaxID=3346786 RepID=UPI00369F6211